MQLSLIWSVTAGALLLSACDVGGSPPKIAPERVGAECAKALRSHGEQSGQESIEEVERLRPSAPVQDGDRWTCRFEGEKFDLTVILDPMTGRHEVTRYRHQK